MAVSFSGVIVAQKLCRVKSGLGSDAQLAQEGRVYLRDTGFRISPMG